MLIANFIGWAHVLDWAVSFITFYVPTIFLCILAEKLWFSQYLFGKVWSAKQGLNPTRTWFDIRPISSRIRSKMLLLTFYYVMIYYWEDFDHNFLLVNFALCAVCCFVSYIYSVIYKGKPFLVFMIETGVIIIQLLIFNLMLVVLFIILTKLDSAYSLRIASGS